MSNSNKYLRFSNRALDIEPFRVVELLTRAKELARQGRKIIKVARQQMTNQASMKAHQSD